MLIGAKEEELVHYLQEMVRVSCPLNITQLRAKFAELSGHPSLMAFLENLGLSGSKIDTLIWFSKYLKV